MNRPDKNGYCIVSFGRRYLLRFIIKWFNKSNAGYFYDIMYFTMKLLQRRGYFNGQQIKSTGMRIVIKLALLVVVLAACKKSTINNKLIYTAGLPGKWNFVASYLGTGGPTSWHPTDSLHQWFLLAENGDVSSNMPMFMDFARCQEPDSTTLKFMAVQGGVFQYHFTLDTLQNELILSPVPLCIEGCAFKFRR